MAIRQLVKAGKFHDLWLTDSPICDEFKNHDKTFIVVHKQFGTIPAEGVNYPQACEMLSYLDLYQERMEEDPDAAIQAALNSLLNEDEEDIH